MEANETARKIAVLRLHLKDGRVYRNQILCLDGGGRLISHTPLTEEVCFMEWYRGDWYEK